MSTVLFKKLVPITAAALGLFSCSSDQEQTQEQMQSSAQESSLQESGLEGSDNFASTGNAGAINSSSGNEWSTSEESAETSNLADAESFLGENSANFVESSAAINSASVNSAPADEFALTDNSGDDAAFVSNGASEDLSLPQNSSSAGMQMASAGGQVLYAPGVVYGYEAPESDVATCALEKGDHPLTDGDANWPRVKEGQYLRSTEMSQSAIARDRQIKNWGE